MDELTRASREEEKKKSLEIYPSDKRNISLSSSHPCRSTSKARVITETIRSLQFLFLSAFLRVFPSILWWRKVRFLYLSQQRFVKSLNSISRVANSSYTRYTKVGLAYLLILIWSPRVSVSLYVFLRCGVRSAAALALVSTVVVFHARAPRVTPRTRSSSNRSINSIEIEIFYIYTRVIEIYLFSAFISTDKFFHGIYIWRWSI